MTLFHGFDDWWYKETPAVPSPTITEIFEMWDIFIAGIRRAAPCLRNLGIVLYDYKLLRFWRALVRVPSDPEMTRRLLQVFTGESNSSMPSPRDAWILKGSLIVEFPDRGIRFTQNAAGQMIRSSI